MEGERLVDGEFKATDTKIALRYLCRKYRPALLGRNAVEMAAIEMVSLMHDTMSLKDESPILADVSDLLDGKNFFAGNEVTWMDFCMHAMIQNSELEAYP
jgi:hypothetical protein